jgi:hypothetical protein
MGRTLWTALAIWSLACSDPVGVCDGPDQGLGIPDFDVVGALRGTGAQVEELGERLDLTLFSVGTQVLRVDGHEVLLWEYCSSSQFVRDIGLLGVGVQATEPPTIALGPEDHVFSMSRKLLWYTGDDPPLIQLLTDVLGPEIRP